MNNGMILFITLGLICLGIILVQYFLWKSRAKDKETIHSDWESFLKASSKNNIQELNYYGDKLIWNKYLKQKQLSEITRIVDSKIKVYPELEQLKLNALNKQLHYNRILPTSGSSGGIKQSW